MFKTVYFLKTVCKDGLYGLNCTQQCVGHCLNNAVCNHVTGLCDEGCAAGWSGNNCNKGQICYAYVILLENSKPQDRFSLKIQEWCI